MYGDGGGDMGYVMSGEGSWVTWLMSVRGMDDSGSVRMVLLHLLYKGEGVMMDGEVEGQRYVMSDV